MSIFPLQIPSLISQEKELLVTAASPVLLTACLSVVTYVLGSYLEQLMSMTELGSHAAPPLLPPLQSGWCREVPAPV
jgi:hypothetical protein